MIPTFIFGVSLLTFLQFFVSYTRSLIAESQTQELGDETREICGIATRAPAGDQFQWLLQLAALCPESGEEGGKMAAVSAYFRLLNLARILSKRLIPSASAWIETERSGCAYLAAVVLDRRIAHSRQLMAQQASH